MPIGSLIPAPRPPATVGLRQHAKNLLFGMAAAGGITKALLRRQSRGKVLIVCYHGVVAEPHVDEFLYRNTVSIREFSAQLELLARHFRFISARELTLAVANGAPLAPRPVLVTFDDGYRNNLIHAVPVLKRHGVPALFSVVTGLIGTDSALWTEEVNLQG